MIIDSEEYRKQGFSQSQKNEKLMAVRGNIYDRNNNLLTNNIIHYSIGVHPSKVKDKIKFANIIANSTERDASYYINKLNSKSDFIYLHRNLRQAKVKSIIDKIQDVPGDIVETGTWRGGTAIWMTGVVMSYEALKAAERRNQTVAPIAERHVRHGHRHLRAI